MKTLVLFALLVALVLGQQHAGHFDSVRQKLMASIHIINNQNEDPTVILAALSTGLDAIFGGNMIVLPSKASYMNQQDMELFGQLGESVKGSAMDFERGPKGFNMTISHIDLLLSALNTFLSATSPSMKQESEPMSATAPARAIVLEAKDFLLFTKEILLNLARYTIKCNPNVDLSVQGDMCKIFLASDESETVMDDVLNKMKFMDNSMFRQIRSPFFFPRTWLMFDIERRVAEGGVAQNNGGGFGLGKYQTGSLDNGQCSVILENLFGLRAVFRPATVTIWNMPWLSASSLIGRKVFTFEWVPSQLLKTISLCHTLNPTTMRSEIVQHVSTETVLHRGALLFWQLFD